MPVSYATVAAALALTCSCGSDEPARITIAAHYVPACSPAAESAPEQLELVALGDFDRDNDSVAILASDAASRGVSLPAATRAVELNSLGGGGFWGYGALGAHNQLPILLWPRDRACALARFEPAAGTPDANDPDAWSLGASARLEAVLVSGPFGAGSRPELSFIDLKDASVSPLGGDGSPVARREASLSELGDALVLAGGIDVASGRASASAELFDPERRRFTGASRSLSVPRARHAAVSLAGGQTLLIGGVSETGQALRSVEVLSTGSTRVSRLYDLLEQPRIAPRAVLLEPDRILVGGGYTLDADQTRRPIESVEFVSTDFTDVTEPPIALVPPALDRAFVSLGAAGALAVGGCARAAGEADCIPCPEGCVSRAAWWIDALGTPHELEPLPAALSVARPKLVAGAGGSPWLIAGGQLGRFDPWLGRFERVELGRPAAGSSALGEPVAVRPGLFVWLEAGASGVELLGVQHSLRSEYTQDVAPLLVGSAQGIVPHQPPTTTSGPVQLSYSAAAGLELSGAAAVVSVADTEYAAFTLELSLSAGAPPLLRLVAARGAQNDAAFGGIDCPWPDVEPGAPDTPVRLRVQRSLDDVRLDRLVDGVPVEPRPEPCRRALPERVRVQLVGTPAGTTRLTRIEIRRSVE